MSVIDTFGTAWLMLFLKLLAAAPKDAACVYLGSMYLSESAIHILLLYTWHCTTWGCMLEYMISSLLVRQLLVMSVLMSIAANLSTGSKIKKLRKRISSKLKGNKA